MMNFKFEISNFKVEEMLDDRIADKSHDAILDDWIADEIHAFNGLFNMIAYVLE